MNNIRSPFILRYMQSCRPRTMALKGASWRAPSRQIVSCCNMWCSRLENIEGEFVKRDTQIMCQGALYCVMTQIIELIARKKVKPNENYHSFDIHITYTYNSLVSFWLCFVDTIITPIFYMISRNTNIYCSHSM